MKKKDIIKKKTEFSEILNLNNNVKNKYYSIYYRDNSKSPRYGISVPTKTGKAVIRNKIKRRVKNIIDNNQKYIQKDKDYVIIIRKGLKDLSYQDMEKEFLNLMKKIGAKQWKRKY